LLLALIAKETSLYFSAEARNANIVTAFTLYLIVLFIVSHGELVGTGS
jgi:hypothetical protein